jgi:hypothetical protein
MYRSFILFRADGHPIAPDQISGCIAVFGDGYSNATCEIIRDSAHLDENGEVFRRCASRILASFGMTRGGVLHERCIEVLDACWREIGTSLLDIRAAVDRSGLPRDRYLLRLDERRQNEVIDETWSLMKRILPFTMGKTSYGLVGASKILFAVLPEITLPVDNAQWRFVFRTVDLGDVLRSMVADIQEWEDATGEQLNTLDKLGRLSTLPSVYNVMAMKARP